MGKSAILSALLLGAVVACSSSKNDAGSSGGASSSGDVADAGETTEEEDAGASSGGPTTQCTAARSQLLVPIAKVSAAEVKVVSETNGVRRIYVDAAAGGQAGASKNPRVYLDLASGKRVDVNDNQAFTSTAWDLALKRTVVFTNSGDAGPGKGGGVDAKKSFEAVTAADGEKAKAEKFFDANCEPLTDAIGGPATTFSDWYDYDQATNGVTPRPTAYVVRSGSGKLFKVKIVSFTANPDGTTNRASTGYFLLDVAEL